MDALKTWHVEFWLETFGEKVTNRSSCEWEENIKMYFSKIGCENVN
jgi:hypothetical protein